MNATLAKPSTHRPWVIGHRGAAGFRPDHTIAGYQLAIAEGVDAVEPDLVATLDGHVILRHEPEIGISTDAAEKFPERHRRQEIDGVVVEGWFASDFTLAEIKTLRCRQPLPFRNTAWDGLFEVMTFDDLLDLVIRESRARGRQIAIYPEIKHATYHQRLGLPIEPPLMATLERFGYDGVDAPIFIQSFEVTNLRELAKSTKVRLVQLLDDFDARPYDFVAAGIERTYADLMTEDHLAGIAAYACGISPLKHTIVPRHADGSLKAPTTIVADAHAAGLTVHPYTFRDEPAYLATDHQGDPMKEYRQFLNLGIDALFADSPSTAIRARDEWVEQKALRTPV